MSIPQFDNRAKNALSTAQQIAIQMNHQHIGSEHLLFGILSQPQDGLAFQMSFIDNLSNQELLDIINKQGLDYFQNKNKSGDNDQDKTAKTFEKSKTTNYLPEITQELQDCIDTAIRTAEHYGYDYIGLEHLVYGLIEVPDSNAQKIIGLTTTARTKLQEILIDVFVTKTTVKVTVSAGERVGDVKKNTTAPKAKSETALSYFTIDLNEKVAGDKNFDIFQREREVDRLIEILSRKVKNNPIILGEPGVGKTALVEGLAKRINDKKVPKWLQDKKILSLEVGGLIAGSMFRGEFEQRVKILVNEMAAAKNCILFIDELHTVIGAGNSSNGGPDLASIIKPALSRGEIAVIGATTEDEYRTIIKKDKAFERRFQSVRLDEPDQQVTTNIIRGIKPVYEAYHNVKFPDELVTTLVDLTGRFIADRFFPDKAIDILDECMVRTRIEHSVENSEITEQDWEKIETELLNLIKTKNDAIVDQNSSIAQYLEQKQKDLEIKLGELNILNRVSKQVPVITKEILEKTVSEVSGVPLVRVSSSIFTRVKNLESSLGNYIFGQDEPIASIAKALKRNYAGVNPNKGPIASFLLLGPTGVGKTELVKLLTQELYGDVNKYLLKIDMSEFREKHNISRLLGAPAGYVGYEDAPQLTEFLRKKPYSVILFDEIEKGHPDSLNILLQMLEDGKVTDSKGNSVSCEHALIFLTSNLGKTRLNKFASKLGFIDMEQQDEQNYESIKTQVMEEVEKSLKPEILGRITSKIVFRPITQTVLQKVINKELGLIQKHLLKQGRTINFAPEITEYVAKLANTKIEYGAREVKSLVANSVQDQIAEFILDNTTSMNMIVKVSKDSQSIIVEKQKGKTVVESKVAKALKEKKEVEIKV